MSEKRAHSGQSGLDTSAVTFTHRDRGQGARARDARIHGCSFLRASVFSGKLEARSLATSGEGRGGVKQDQSARLFGVFHRPHVAGEVGSWIQPGLFLLGSSVEKEQRKDRVYTRN